MKTTGLSRVSKELIIADLEKELRSRPSFFVARHGAVSAPVLDELRAKLRSANTRYFVVKNRLAKRALEKAKLEALADSLSGSCGIAFSGADPVQPSKVLVEFEKANEIFKIQKGYVNGAVVGVEQIKVLASLPSREVLLARVAGGIQAPIAGFVNVLAGTIRKIVTVLDAVAKKKAGN